MILSTRRHEGSIAKADKDVVQAGILIEALSRRRSFELGEALALAEGRGQKWKSAIKIATTALDDRTYELLEKSRADFGMSA